MTCFQQIDNLLEMTYMNILPLSLTCTSLVLTYEGQFLIDSRLEVG